MNEPGMKSLIEKLYLTNRAFITDDYDWCLDYINKEVLPLKIHKYPSGKQIWDSWVIPSKWIVEEAYIASKGNKILDFKDHPLHLISYSSPYEGNISREELREHLYFCPHSEEAIPFHFRLNYRPWESEWGFCASKKFVDSLDQEEYYVSIKTRFEDGYLKVAEHHLAGQSKETIVLAAHLDHAGMANDDLAGCVVGLHLMKRLANLENRRYSYKLLLAPEILGTAAYLESNEEPSQDFKYAIFLEMLGNDNRLALQKSFTGNTKLDEIAEYVLRTSCNEFKVEEFRESVGNDEIIFESPGYEIPTISIHRYPYAEYHTSLDNPAIISEERLRDSLDYLLKVTDILEKDFTPKRKFKGLISVANPKYDLYIDPGQPALSGANYQIARNLIKFKDGIFRYLDGDYSVFDIAQKFELDFDFVHDYLTKFYEKGLIDIIY